jgi:hypothetical protein
MSAKKAARKEKMGRYASQVFLMFKHFSLTAVSHLQGYKWLKLFTVSPYFSSPDQHGRDFTKI